MQTLNHYVTTRRNIKSSKNKKSDCKKFGGLSQIEFRSLSCVVSVLECDRPTLCPHPLPLLYTPSNQEMGNVPLQSKHLPEARTVTSFVKGLAEKTQTVQRQ